MGKNKLKIGEFSRLGRVTVRALRHYEEIDLLTPEIVDRDTCHQVQGHPGRADGCLSEGLRPV